MIGRSSRAASAATLGLLALAGAAAGMSAGCGKSLVPGTAADRPLLTLVGSIAPTGGLQQARHPVIGLLWTDPLQQRPDVPMPARWLRSTVNASNDTFTAEVFRPPPPEAVVEVKAAGPDGESAALAVAELVIIDDLDEPDGDGTFRVSGPRAEITPPDRYLAGSQMVLTYVARPFPSPKVGSPLTLPGQAGYKAVNYLCQGRVSQGVQEADPLGIIMLLQPSTFFPEVRTCQRDHSP